MDTGNQSLEELKGSTVFMDILSEREKVGERIGEERGKRAGAAALLCYQMEKQFGELPDWALQQLSDAELGQLCVWGLRLLKSETLEAIFGEQ